jgi:dihydrofolate reductase
MTQMKLTTMTQVTVDGVMQANGGSDPDLDPGFDRGGWAMPYFEEESGTYVTDFCRRADAFLYGRRTYDLFARYWGTMEPGSDPIADAFSSKPKYVASATLQDPPWEGTTVLSDDVAGAIAELKATGEGELQVHGSGQLIRWLLEQQLVDEITLLVCPVVVGRGTRLFADDGPDLALDLVESRTFPQGLALQVYRAAGRPEYAA